MRLAHKRNVQLKLKKTIKATKAVAAKPKKVATAKVEKAVKAKPVAKVEVVESAAVETAQDVKLTPKQQQVFDIVKANAEGISPKAIGLEAGQEDAKAAAWATGGLKKLLEENLVVKESAGNKVTYKLA